MERVIRHTLPLLDLSSFATLRPETQQLILRHLPTPAVISPTMHATAHTVTRSTSIPIPKLPFYSQFSDISSPQWQKVACGIASVAMIIDHYSDEPVVPDTLLSQGIKSGAYIDSAGWSHQGLINLAGRYGLTGGTHSLAHLSKDEAFVALKDVLTEGPVMASVYYTFEPTNPIPHLVVITGIDEQGVHYSDPAEQQGNQVLPPEKFKNAWKKRYISIRQS